MAISEVSPTTPPPETDVPATDPTEDTTQPTNGSATDGSTTPSDTQDAGSADGTTEPPPAETNEQTNNQGNAGGSATGEESTNGSSGTSPTYIPDTESSDSSSAPPSDTSTSTGITEAADVNVEPDNHFLQEIIDGIQAADTPDQMNLALMQAEQLARPQQLTAADQAQDASEGDAADEKKKEAAQKDKKQQISDQSLRLVYRLARTHSRTIIQQAKMSGNTDLAEAARRFTGDTINKRLGELAKQQFQSNVKTPLDALAKLLGNKGSASTFTHMSAKKPGDGKPLTAGERAAIDEGEAHAIEGDEGSLREEDATTHDKQLREGWRKRPEKGSVEDVRRRELKANEKVERNQVRDALQTERAEIRKHITENVIPALFKHGRIRDPEDRAAGTAHDSAAVVFEGKRKKQGRALNIVHGRTQDDDSEGSGNGKPFSREEGARDVVTLLNDIGSGTSWAGALHACAGGAPVVPATERFIATRPIPTVDLTDPTTGKNQVIELAKLLRPTGFRFDLTLVPTAFLGARFRNGFDPASFKVDVYNSSLDACSTVAMSLLQRCAPSITEIDMHP